MSERQDIYVRAYTRPLKQKSKKSHWYPDPPKWADHALIFDCETRVTADQTLTFGFWRFCELREGQYVALEEGILLDDNGELNDKEIKVIVEFAKRNKAETADDGYDHIRVYSRSKFIREVLGLAIQAKAFIVCFNSGFDFSRIAVDWTPAKNGGWSLIFSQWRDPETGKLKPLKFFPRIVIKALNSKTSIIHSTRPPLFEPRTEDEKVKHWPGARFLDPRTLLWALRNRSYSLESACKEFKTEHQKIDHQPTGKAHVKKSNMPEAMSHARLICSMPQNRNLIFTRFQLAQIECSALQVWRRVTWKNSIFCIRAKSYESRQGIRGLPPILFRRPLGIENKKLGSASVSRGFHVPIPDRE